MDKPRTMDNKEAVKHVGASEEAIQAHYDVDNDFYKLWLDETMTYSAALFASDDDQDLTQAQYRKLDFHLDNVCTKAGDTLLDIGCGWGALGKRAANKYSAKTVGLTLSHSQYEWIEADTLNKMDVFLEGWEQHNPEGLYDGIVSIGAFEHFARHGCTRSEKIANYTQFFEKCWGIQKKDGYMSLQTIVYENYDEDNPNMFVTEIFPESDLPRLSDVLLAAEHKYELVTISNDRLHYKKTLQKWYRNFINNKDKIIAKYGEDLYDKYLKYLGIFIFGFGAGTVNLSRLRFKRIETLQQV
ncbi:MAG: cyclopropane-fatty-acyl-phospholipid synthase family protein [Pseudomonadota bacterium]